MSAATLFVIAIATALCGALAGFMLGARRTRTRRAQRPITPSEPGSLLNVKSGGDMPRRSWDVTTTPLGYYSFSATYS